MQVAGAHRVDALTHQRQAPARNPETWFRQHHHTRARHHVFADAVGGAAKKRQRERGVSLKVFQVNEHAAAPVIERNHLCLNPQLWHLLNMCLEVTRQKRQRPGVHGARLAGGGGNLPLMRGRHREHLRAGIKITHTSISTTDTPPDAPETHQCV